MGAGAVVRGTAVVAALAPAVAWYAVPVSPLHAVVVAVLAVIAALHGLGRIVGAIAGDGAAPVALTIAWGLAAYLALAGMLAGLGVFDAGAQRVLMVVATAVGAAWCGQAAAAAWARAPGEAGTARVGAGWRGLRPGLWMIAPAAAAALLAIHVLGAAGTTTGRFFDGEVYLLGPLARLRDTGELGDAFGMPRTSGLGGSVLLASLGAAFEHARQVHVVDALGLALTVALAFAGTPRHPARVIALFSIVVLASAMPVYPTDLAPRWSVVALLFALHASLGRMAAPGARPWPALLLAGALATIWHAGWGVVAVIAVHTVGGAPASGRARRTAALGAAIITALALAGPLLSAVSALGREPAADGVIATLARGAPARVAVWSGVALAVYALAGMAVRDLGDRALHAMVPVVAVAAFAAGLLSPSIAMAWIAWQPFAIALLLLLIAPALMLAPRPALHPATGLAIVGIVLAIAVLRFPVGVPRISWEDRLVRLLDGANTLVEQASRRDAIAAAEHAAARRRVPPGARVGLWLDRPDLIDYRGADLIDLRSAATTDCVDRIPLTPTRVQRRPRACARLDALLPRLDLDFLLVSPSALPRPEAWFRRPRCFLLHPLDCIDPITRFVGRDRMHTPGAVVVIDLRGEGG